MPVEWTEGAQINFLIYFIEHLKSLHLSLRFSLVKNTYELVGGARL